MIDKIKLFINNNKIFILSLISATLVTCFAVILIVSNNGNNINKKSLKPIYNQMNSINDSLDVCIKDLTIDTTLSSKTLLDAKSSLDALAKEVISIETDSDEDILKKQSISNSISATSSLYDFCLYIINNPKEINSSETINKLNSLKEDCLKTYLDIDLEFSNSALTFLDNTNNYINTIIKINRDNDFKSTQQQNYLLALNDLSLELYKLSEDLMPAITKIREDNRDIQIIIDDIYSKEQSIISIKNKIAETSIPDGCMDYYDALQEFIKIYDVYLKSIKEAVVYEKTCTDMNKNKKIIDTNYKNAASKHQDVINYYESFNELIKNY